MLSMFKIDHRKRPKANSAGLSYLPLLLLRPSWSGVLLCRGWILKRVVLLAREDWNSKILIPVVPNKWICLTFNFIVCESHDRWSYQPFLLRRSRQEHSCCLLRDAGTGLLFRGEVKLTNSWQSLLKNQSPHILLDYNPSFVSHYGNE